MAETKKIIVVGGGPGGLTSAMLLAHKGFEVVVYEKQAEVGGRSGRVTKGGYSFDAGSTLLMMKFVLDEKAFIGVRHMEVDGFAPRIGELCQR